MTARISAHAKTVLGVLAGKRCHLTAEEILARVDGMGTATVYRALDHLAELGMIRKLSIGKKSAVYEYNREQHMHFVCRRCGEVFDIQADFSGMIFEAAKCCGHQPSWSEVTAHGLSSACAELEENAAAPDAAQATTAH